MPEELTGIGCETNYLPG